MVVDSSKKRQETGTAVLCSGGLDSAVLVAHETNSSSGPVQPIYITAGLSWETSELEASRRLLEAPTFKASVRPLVQLDCPVIDTYPNTHWALGGTPPAYDTPDEDVYLVGRNVLLLAKVSTFCALNRIARIAVGPLSGNPFPDATPAFFDAMERALSLGLAHEIRITAPFRKLSKKDVIELGASLEVPFELTLSCMSPDTRRHCGRCSKCRERLQAFDAAGIIDPADYAFRPGDVVTGA